MKLLNATAVAVAVVFGIQCSAQEPSLYQAVSNGDLALAEKLITDGQDPDQTIESGWTPLHRAADLDHVPIAKLLIDEGANVNAKGGENGWTPLLFAVQNASLPMAKLLIDSGASVNAESKAGWTPLHRAAANKNRLLVHMLMQAGALDNATYKREGTDVSLRPSDFWGATPDTSKGTPARRKISATASLVFISMDVKKNGRA